MKIKLVFLLLFAILGFVALQIPVATLKGSRVPFTVFDLFAPISGAFLGSPLGILAVVLMQGTNLVAHGFSGLDQSSLLKLVATLRFLPAIFGVWFFALSPLSFWRPGNRRRVQNLVLLVPALAILAFNLHPIGRTVWFYSLFWTIPFLVWPIRERFLLARSLGSTMTAHAVGGALWIWAFNLPAAVWVSLIPLVIMERAIFTLGISASYIFMNNVLAFLSAKKLLPKSVSVDKRYLLKT